MKKLLVAITVMAVIFASPPSIRHESFGLEIKKEREARKWE